MILRFLRRLLVLALLLVIALGLTLKVRYGGGADFPDRSGAARLPAEALELVADLPTPPGNIAVSASGRVFVSLHPEARPALKVVELRNGQPAAWPSPAFQSAQGGEPRHFRSVLGLRIDAQNRLWTLDNADHGIAPARLLAFDIDSGLVVHEFVFPREIAGLGSHLNDFQVSPDGRSLYIADASIFGKSPALIVYDTETRSARRLLQTHPAVVAENYTPVVQGRRMEVFGVFSIRPGVDSIALDDRGEWLYLAPVTNLNLYRVRTADLLNPLLPPSELAGKVEVYAPKTMSDGIAIDSADNLYLTDPEHSAIMLLRPDKTLETLLRDERLRWPDGFSFGPDGWLYVTCSSLHQVIGRLPSQVTANAPYQVFRFKADAAGQPGH